MNNVIKIVLTIILSYSVSVMAQSKKSTKKKRATVNFEDELIKGDVNKPELLYLLRQKEFNYKKLIKLRENFLTEMRSTAESLQLGR